MIFYQDKGIAGQSQAHLADTAQCRVWAAEYLISMTRPNYNHGEGQRTGMGMERGKERLC